MKDYMNFIPKELIDFNRSEEYLKECENYEILNQKYIRLQKQYNGSYHELNKAIESRIYRREYSKGGKNIHRGFYSPSNLDLVHNNCNRGKLLKKSPKNNNYDYEYLFDSQNNIICVKNTAVNSMEFLVSLRPNCLSMNRIKYCLLFLNLIMIIL